MMISLLSVFRATEWMSWIPLFLETSERIQLSWGSFGWYAKEEMVFIWEQCYDDVPLRMTSLLCSLILFLQLQMNNIDKKEKSFAFCSRWKEGMKVWWNVSVWWQVKNNKNTSIYHYCSLGIILKEQSTILFYFCISEYNIESINQLIN